MWCYQSLLEINRADIVSNDQVLLQVNKHNRTMIDTIKARKSRWLEHTLRHNSATPVALEG